MNIDRFRFIFPGDRQVQAPVCTTRAVTGPLQYAVRNRPVFPVLRHQHRSKDQTAYDNCSKHPGDLLHIVFTNTVLPAASKFCQFPAKPDSPLIRIQPVADPLRRRLQWSLHT